MPTEVTLVGLDLAGANLVGPVPGEWMTDAAPRPASAVAGTLEG